jgi:hypothetical protein
VEAATWLLPWSCLLCIAILTDFHHDRIKDNMERVVMPFYVFIKLLLPPSHFNCHPSKKLKDQGHCYFTLLPSRWLGPFSALSHWTAACPAPHACPTSHREDTSSLILGWDSNGRTTIKAGWRECNVNAQVNYKVKTVIKQKPWWCDMHRSLPLLKKGRKLVFLTL